MGCGLSRPLRTTAHAAPSYRPASPPADPPRDEKATVRELLTQQYLSEVRIELRNNAGAGLGSGGLKRLRREYWKLFYWEDFPDHFSERDGEYVLVDYETDMAECSPAGGYHGKSVISHGRR